MASVLIFHKHFQKWTTDVFAESMMLSVFLSKTDLCKSLHKLPEKDLL